MEAMMPSRVITGMLTGVLALGSAAGVASAQVSATRRVSLPENPCDVLTSAEMSAVTHLRVTEVHRAPSIAKIVQAQRENAAPVAGTICVYTTESDFGAINIAVPSPGDRGSAKYWDDRIAYFRAYPGSARPISDLGEDAWLGAGTSLQVLVGPDQIFSVSTQMYQRRGQELLTNIARKILERLR